MKKLFLSVFILVLSIAANAQMVDPVHFTSQLNMLSGDEAEIVFSAKIDKGWHLYSTDLGNDGPISATFNINRMDGAKTVGKLTPKGKEISQFDKMFGMKLRFFEGNAKFVQRIKFTKDTYDIDCYLEYGACNDEMCMPPSQVSLIKKGKTPAVQPAAKEAGRAGEMTETAKDDKIAKDEAVIGDADGETQIVVAQTDSAAAKTDTIKTAGNGSSEGSSLWEPVITELKAYDDNAMDNSLFYIFLAGLAGGFLALLTPCVWPIIPMTVSFFLKRNKERSKAVREAVTYGVSIVVISLEFLI